MAKAYRIGLLCGHDRCEWTAWNEGQPSGEADHAMVVRDEHGELDAAACKELKRSAEGASRVVVALPTERVLLRVERFPATAAEDLAAMVALRADAISPFPVDQIVHGWEILEPGEEETLVLIAVCRRADVEALVGPVRDAVGLVARVDVAALCWWHRLQVGGHVVSRGREMVVVVGGTAVELIIHDRGQLLAVASLGRNVEGDGTLAEDVAWEISHMLRSLGLEFGAEEVVLSLWGGDGAFLAELKERTGLATDVSSLSVVKGTLAGAVAWRDAIQAGGLDLTPPQWRAAEREARFRRRLVQGVVAALAVWVVFMGGLFGWRMWREWQVGRLVSEHAAWAAPASEVLQMRRRLGMIHRYMDRHDSALEALLAVVSCMPDEGLELIEFNYRKNNAVVVEGYADSGQLRLGFQEALNGSELFKRVEARPVSIVKNRERFKLELFFTKEAP